MSNRAYGNVAVVGTPPSDGTYQVNIPTAPPGTSGWQIIGYTPMSSGAPLGAASLNGKASPTAPPTSTLAVPWPTPRGHQPDRHLERQDASNNDLVVDVADGGASISRIAGNGPYRAHPQRHQHRHHHRW